jgi:heme a synthase
VPRPELTPAAYRKITFAALVLLGFIIATGAAVRLSGSGLGCPDWPTCTQGQLVSALELHPMIEFVNRMITGLVSVVVILAVLGSLARIPRRPDLVWLSVGLVAGVLGQIVLGGMTVLFELRPSLVMAHFLLSQLLVWNAVVLHERAGQADGAPRPAIDPTTIWLGRVVVGATGVVLILGTVVTAAGPHGGDEKVARLGVAVTDAVRVHGAAVWVLLAAAAILVRRLTRAGADSLVLYRAEVLLGLIVAQGALGYMQYFADVPALMVGLHVIGATLVWIAALRLHISLFERPAITPGSPESATLVRWAASSRR